MRPSSKVICSSARRSRFIKDAEVPDPCLLVRNNGRHVFVGHEVSFDGFVTWHWALFRQFQAGNYLSTVLKLPEDGLYLRLYGHSPCGTASVMLRQYFKRVSKKGTTESIRDWQMHFWIPPHKIILIHADSDSVFASRLYRSLFEPLHNQPYVTL